MTSPDHLSRDQLSDLLAGVRPAAEALAAYAHVSSCPDCDQRRDDLLAVTARLHDEAAQPIAMPDDVVTAVTAALDRAGAERAAGIRTLEPVRRPPVRLPLRWLTGAAAAVVVAGLGVAGLRAIDTGGAGSTNDAGGASAPDSPGVGGADKEFASGGGQQGTDEGVPPHASGSPTTTGSPALDLPPVRSGDQVAAQARRLDAGLAIVSPSAVGCRPPITGRPTTVIRFDGAPAVLSIVRSTRLATVYDCTTGTQPLFVGGY